MELRGYSVILSEQLQFADPAEFPEPRPEGIPGLRG